MNTHRKSVDRQKGMVTVFMAIGLAVIMVIAGMGIDLGHAYVNKTKTQTLVDALALTGAKTLDTTTSSRATTDINDLFDHLIQQSGYENISNTLNFNDLLIEYSDELYPFVHVPGGAGPYVRVSTNSLTFGTWLVRATGNHNTLTISASAVAGPSVVSNNLCDASPIVICGDTTDDPFDPNHSGDSFWGYETGQVTVLKTGAGASGSKSACIGPGNSHLARLPGANGKDDVREALAGGGAGCFINPPSIGTEPGVGTGPFAQGINTRFNQYTAGHLSAADYPPDKVQTQNSTDVVVNEDANGCVTGSCLASDEDCQPNSRVDSTDINYNHADYEAATSSGSFDLADGEILRRILRVPVADCSVDVGADGTEDNGEPKGQSDLKFLGTACFFLINDVDVGGKESLIFGEFVRNCTSDGGFGIDPGTGPGVTTIVLHDDPLRQES